MGSISAGHARAILSIDEPDMQIKLARQAAASKLFGAAGGGHGAPA